MRFFETLKAQHPLLGFADSRLILPYLLRLDDPFDPTSRAPLVLIDVGANTGDTSAALVGLFTSSECARYLRVLPQPKDAHDGCPRSRARIFAFEPLSANFRVLSERAAEGGWAESGWTGVNAAAVSPELAVNGSIVFFGDENVGNQQGSLDVHASRATIDEAANKWRMQVRALTIDAHLAASGLQEATISLLKVDTEGFDGHVLRGAQKALALHRVRAIVFEYNDKWRFAKGESLEGTVAFLESLEYECFMITPSLFIPISAVFWDARFEWFGWSNVLCMVRGARETTALVAFFNALH